MSGKVAKGLTPDDGVSAVLDDVVAAVKLAAALADVIGAPAGGAGADAAFALAGLAVEGNGSCLVGSVHLARIVSRSINKCQGMHRAAICEWAKARRLRTAQPLASQQSQNLAALPSGRTVR